MMSSSDQRSEWDKTGDEEEHSDEQFSQGGERVPEVFVVSSALFGGSTVEAVVDCDGVVKGAEEEEGGDDEEDGVVAHRSDGWCCGGIVSKFSLEKHQRDGQKGDGERDSEEDVCARTEQAPPNIRVPSVVSDRVYDTNGTEYDG